MDKLVEVDVMGIDVELDVMIEETNIVNSIFLPGALGDGDDVMFDGFRMEGHVKCGDEMEKLVEEVGEEGAVRSGGHLVRRVNIIYMWTQIFK